MKKLIVIGGGFAGLVLCNRLLDKNSEDFLLLEKSDRLGKKILVTGNGRCNLTNEDISVCHYHGEHPEFAAYALEKYGQKALEDFFFEKGLMLSYEEGRAYPLSKVANSVLDCLRARLDNGGGKDLIKLNSSVVGITRENGYYTVFLEDGGKYSAENVVVASGGKSGQGLGTDGSAYELLRSLGHSVTELSPSLVQLKTSAFGKFLKGVKHKAAVSLFDSERYICSFEGDFLFVDNGVSGNAVFNVSSRIAETKKPYLKIDFIPQCTKEEIVAALKNKVKTFGFLSATTLLTGYVHSSLSQWIISVSGLKNKTLGELTGSDISLAVARVKGYVAPIEGTFGFSCSQVTHGGVRTDEVNEKTFESKLKKGLFIVGEALDIDGDCGGYNLQWAFSSAMAAAENFV